MNKIQGNSLLEQQQVCLLLVNKYFIFIRIFEVNKYLLVNKHFFTSKYLFNFKYSYKYKSDFLRKGLTKYFLIQDYETRYKVFKNEFHYCWTFFFNQDFFHRDIIFIRAFFGDAFLQ